MLNNKNIKLIFLFGLFFLFLSTSFVSALEINYPRIPGATPPQEFLPTTPPEQHLSLYVLYIFNLTIWISGIIALGVLVYAGILYLISSGKPEAIISARNQISASFFGLLLLLSSYLILQVLNPQLVILEIPKLKEIKEILRPEVPSPSTELHRSSISTEIPFSTLIEKRIFEEPRMTRIKDNAGATLEIATGLKENSEELQAKTEECSCSQAEPRCDGCVSGRTCTSDTCDSVRGEIEELEQDNLAKIDELKAEQIKSTEEARLLKEELNRLERAERLMLECQLWPLNSLAEFLEEKKFYLANKWLFLDTKFWDWILTVEEWASFYCPVSGAIWGLQPLSPQEIEEITKGLPPLELPEEVLEPAACTIEVPVGEIIDRAKRTGYRLVERLEKMTAKSQELIEAVDKLQVAISQCSSQNCTSICIHLKKCSCLKYCTGTPCPYGKIGEQVSAVQEIVKEIEKIVKEENKEEIGIIPVIDKIVPKLLEDLAKEVRKPMKECIAEISPQAPEEQPPIILSDCPSAVRTIGPKGIVIQNCCLEEPEFQFCLEKCYPEEGQKNYKKCLENCLSKEAEKLRGMGKTRESEIIATCQHKINFYCCGK